MSAIFPLLFCGAKCRWWPLASLRGSAANGRFWGHIGRGAMARKQLARKLLFPSKLKSGCQRPRSVLLSQHNGDHTLGDRWISRIWRMAGEGFVKIIDLEKDRVTIGFERAKVVLLVGSLAWQKSSNTAIVLTMRATASAPRAATPQSSRRCLR